MGTPFAGEGMVEGIVGIHDIDLRVLRWVCSHDAIQDEAIVFGPKFVALNIDASRNYVSKRCARMADVGILKRLARGEYQLSSLGIKMCHGELTDAEIDELESAIEEYESS